MKKIFFLVAMMVAFLCTGCVRYSYEMDINDNDEIVIKSERSLDYAPLKHRGFSSLLKNDMQDIISEYTNSGYLVETYHDNKKAGLVLKRAPMTFGYAENNLPKGFKNTGSKIFTTNRGLLGKYYKINFYYSLHDVLSDDLIKNYAFREQSQAFQKYKDYLPDYIVEMQYGSYLASGNRNITKIYASGKHDETFDTEEMIKQNERVLNPKAELRIKIPKGSKVIRHNATRVESDNIYYWDLSYQDESVLVNLEYERSEILVLAMIFSILIFVFAVLSLDKVFRKGSPVQGL